MKQVLKYVVNPSHQPQNLGLRRGAEIVHVGVDGKNDMCVWALTDLNRLVDDDRWFLVVGTGVNVADKCTHVGTAIMPEGPATLVWHLFEVDAA